MRWFSETFSKVENKQQVSVITQVRSDALILRNKPTVQNHLAMPPFRLLTK
jgi:hypothetical protein